MKIEDLPRPSHYRRQMAKNGGYEMVPAYTAEEVLGILEGINRDSDRYRWLKEYYCPEVGRYETEIDRAFINSKGLDESIDAEIKKVQE